MKPVIRVRQKKFFTAELLSWNKMSNNRSMPWKSEKDPYKIWISEIILQQTRVQQGLAYYNRFIDAFPTVKDLAGAEEQKVFKLWEGLGYYSRCRNIIASSKYITIELEGEFPHDFEGILKLKGVGNYTASAIASFAYNLPHAVLDGNVFRVLSRFFGIATAIDSAVGKTLFSNLADELLEKTSAAIYNQAIMDFGAVICKPKPICNVCPLKKKCFAFANNLINTLPVKEKTIIRKNRWLHYLLITYEDKVYIRKRAVKDIWQNLNEFVLIEAGKLLSLAELKHSKEFKAIFTSNPFTVISVSKIYRQQLTHQTITGQFIKINVKSPLSLPGYQLLPATMLSLLPFPKFITTYLKD